MDGLSRRPTGSRLRTIAVVAIPCLWVAACWIVWMSIPYHRITDRELLHEAVLELQSAGAAGGGMSRLIFEQQAVQGYYDEAAATARLVEGSDGGRWWVVELARIRAENGDLEGAKATLRRFAGSEFGPEIAVAIAQAQAHKGDLEGALELAANGADTDKVLEVYARRQIGLCDFAAALATAERMKSPDNVFYAVENALVERNLEAQILELASGMKDRKLAASFRYLTRISLWPGTLVHVKPGTPCDAIYHLEAEGKFAEAAAGDRAEQMHVRRVRRHHAIRRRSGGRGASGAHLVEGG